MFFIVVFYIVFFTYLWSCSNVIGLFVHYKNYRIKKIYGIRGYCLVVEHMLNIFEPLSSIPRHKNSMCLTFYWLLFVVVNVKGVCLSGSYITCYHKGKWWYRQQWRCLGKTHFDQMCEKYKKMNGHLSSFILLNLYLVTHSKNDGCQSISLKIIFYKVEFGASWFFLGIKDKF